MIEDKLVTEYFILLTLYYIIFGVKGEIHQKIPILNENLKKIYHLTRNVLPFLILLDSFSVLFGYFILQTIHTASS